MNEIKVFNICTHANEEFLIGADCFEKAVAVFRKRVNVATGIRSVREIGPIIIQEDDR